MKMVEHINGPVMQSLFANQITAAARQKLRRFLGGKEDGIAGVAAIEFSIVAPPLILMMICVADIGMGMYRKIQVQNAAQSGAEYAIAKAADGFNPTAIAAAVTSATAFTGIAANPAPSQACGCPTNAGITNVSCGSTCADGGAAGSYVTVTAQGAYNTLLPYPILPSSYSFVSQSTVRIE